MTLDEKVEYLFQTLDLDCDGDIELSEVIIGIKSIEGGLAKMRGEAPAPERRIIDLATDWFNQLQSLEKAADKCDFASFEAFCLGPKHPVLVVFQLYAEAEGSVDVDSDVEKEGNPREPGLLEEEEEGFGERLGGDEFMAVKPYLGAIVAPTSYSKSAAVGPPSTISLQHIHGYRAYDTRNNVKYLAGSKEAVYFGAGEEWREERSDEPHCS